MRLAPFMTAVFVASSIALGGCTTLRQAPDSIPVYDKIKPRGALSYHLESNDPHQRQIFALALDHWNKALGPKTLFLLEKPAADVVVRLEEVEHPADHPATTHLLGCMEGFQSVAKCEVVARVPKAIDSAEDMAKLSHLFVQGTLDAALYAGKTYSDPSEYLRDKLLLMSFIHEIGHTIGLSHAAGNEDCVMAASPSGRLEFCQAELNAARAQLGLSQVIARK